MCVRPVTQFPSHTAGLNLGQTPLCGLLPHPQPSHFSASTAMTLLPRSPLPLIAAAVATLLPLTSLAQPPAEGDAPRSTWAAGLAVMPETQAYRDFDDKLRVLPLLTFENRWVRVFGPGVELKLGRSGPLSYGLTASYARDGYDAGDSTFLAGMDKRRASAWLGGRLGLRTEFASLSAHWQADASGHSKGQKLRLGAERRLAPQQTVFADVGVTLLGGAIKHSPLVDRSTLPELRVGWLYAF